MTRLAFDREFIIEPLIYAVRENLIKHPFRIEIASENKIVQGLQDGEIDIGIISPLSYTRARQSLQIIKELIVASYPYGRNALLFFRENLRQINAIYYQQGKELTFEHFLSKIVLGEFLDIEADWHAVETIPHLPEALEKFPTFLITGDQAPGFSADNQSFIDLTEEWTLKTELPLVHRLVVVGQNFKDKGELRALQLSREVGLRNLMKISRAYAANFNQGWDVYFDPLNRNYRYHPEESHWESLKELLQYAFFYGIAQYYTEIKFF